MAAATAANTIGTTGSFPVWRMTVSRITVVAARRDVSLTAESVGESGKRPPTAV
jgi:hypothetical protein